MRAVFIIDVPDSFLEQRVAEFNGQRLGGEPETARSYFVGRLRDIADDEVVSALNWPAAVRFLEPPERLACRGCGSETIRAWYNVPEAQGVTIDGQTEDGAVAFDYDGCSRSSDPDSDFEYRCSDCDLAAETLEELVGLRRIWVPDWERGGDARDSRPAV